MLPFVGEETISPFNALEERAKRRKREANKEEAREGARMK